MVGPDMTVIQTITTDTALRLFADPQRQRIHQDLVDGDGPAPIDQLTNAIITTPASQQDPDQPRDRFRSNFHHNNLPKLQEECLIRDDRSNGSIRHEHNSKLRGC